MASQPEPFAASAADFTGETEALIPLLIAADDPQLRQMLAGVFTLGGYAVATAEDGLDALEQAQRLRFPIVIADLEMPKLDGIELVRELAALDPYAECLLLAGSDNLPRIIEASEAGNVYNHFWKPLQEMGDLVRSVARALERRELRLSQTHLMTELRDTRHELHVLCSRLEQLDKTAALGQMTTTLAQDMQPPLRSLSAYAQYLRARLERRDEDPLTPEQVDRILDYLREMDAGVRKCGDAVEGILDYTRVHEEPPGPILLHEVVETSLTLLQQGLEAQGISLQLNLAGAVPPVLANPRRLQQALTNVIVNAQQALDKTGGTITLTSQALTDTAGREIGARLRIDDTGPGILPGVLPHIFDPFFTTRSHRQSLGIGLTIARNIVREWRGDIHVESTPGKGTTVTLTLPLCAEIAVPIHDWDAGIPSGDWDSDAEWAA